jgi:UMF1 family MFS transporter
LNEKVAQNPSWLEKLGLHRPELRAWALYDWANSVFMTTVLQVFPLFFFDVAAVGLPHDLASSRFAYATAIGVVVVGLVGPFLGAIADYRGNKKGMLAAFLAVGVLSTAAMGLVERGDFKLALAVFVLGNIGVTSTLAFYNSLLPGIASNEEVDRVSSAGFALGYLGGGLLLALNLWMIAQPSRFGLADQASAMRVSFLTAAIWWAFFSIPLFLKVKEPARALERGERPGESVFFVAFSRLRETVTELRRHKDAALLLLAFLIYNDAISTIIRMATTFGKEADIPNQSLIAAILMVQFVGVPFAFAFGALSDRIGPKRSILLALAVYAFLTVYCFWLRTTFQFFVMAFLVGMVMGGAQALSRSLFATLIPKHKAGELFGFFGVFDRFGGAMGSTVFGYVLSATGSSRPAILALIIFFLLGAALLSQVDVERGRSLAEEENRRVRALAG